MTTGSTVKGLVPGLRQHFGGAEIMFVLGDPNGVVQPASATAPPSGAVVAYDNANNQFYQCEGGSTWFKLGSVN